MTPEQAKAILLVEGYDPDTLERFFKFHIANPWAWKQFESLALEAIKDGVTQWSADNICHVIRWNNKCEKKSDFKINNNYVSAYARLFAFKYPQHKEFFEFRPLKGRREAA